MMRRLQCILLISIHAPSRERPEDIMQPIDERWISIHAPSRERPTIIPYIVYDGHFNPCSLAGATVTPAPTPLSEVISIHAPSRERLMIGYTTLLTTIFQSTLPRGSDGVKTKYFSIHLNQAFIAKQLNSNPQKFYFDVRKLIVSHSSLSCEPKLNSWFIYLRTKNLNHTNANCSQKKSA